LLYFILNCYFVVLFSPVNDENVEARVLSLANGTYSSKIT